MTLLESPLLWVTLIWIVIGIVATVLVRWTDDPALYRLAIWTGVFCLWLMWMIVYVSQINPLLAPQQKPLPKNISDESGAASGARAPVEL